jgi:thymidylate synthase
MSTGLISAVQRASDTWDDVFRTVLAQVLDQGDEVAHPEGLSIGSGRKSLELLNHGFTLPDVHDRLLAATQARFNPFAAVGRFIWMMAGNDRLADVEFYDAGGRKFSDNGMWIPGSCDGARLFNPRPGLNQVERVIGLLRGESGGRRAVATIYQPEDAGRESRDIPCHIAVAYNRRVRGLHCTTMMRSCNAARVLPYDLFLFTLLAEYVACASGTEVASYTHFTVSLHIYGEDLDIASAVVSGSGEKRIRLRMDPMPADGATRDVAALIALEASIRHSCTMADESWFAERDRFIGDTLPPYWQDFARIVLIHSLAKARMSPSRCRHLALEFASRLSPAFRYVTEQHLGARHG